MRVGWVQPLRPRRRRRSNRCRRPRVSPTPPNSPVPGQPVTLNGTSSVCPDGPCTYEWSDDGSPTQPVPALWPLGVGQTLSYAFSELGTKYVRLVITDATGQMSTVEHNLVVDASEPPPPPTAPANTALPVVSGSAVEGQTLTAGNGTWSGSPTSSAYQWEDCNTSGASCSNVSGATSSSYTLAAGDVGHTVRVVVTASNAGGSTPASSAATAAIAAPLPPAPTNIALPTVSGSVVEGQTFSTSTGTWTGSPTSYPYQWEDCNSSGASCSNVSSATSSSYKLVAGDVGHTVRVVVTASNAGGSTSASSAATGTVAAPPPPAPTNTALPTVSGSAVEGQTLSASTGTWNGSPTSYAYQWQDCNSSGASCSNVTGATSSSYKLAAGDVGHTVRAVVTASNAGGSTPASSAQTAAVTSGGGTPGEPSLTAKECFENPETEGTTRIEACGYPGVNNVGVEKGVTLTPASGSPSHGRTALRRQTARRQHHDRARRENVVIKNDAIIDNGACPAPYSINSGCVANAIEFDRNGSSEAAKGTLISHVSVGGSEVHGPNTVQTCIDARWNSPYVAEYVKTQYCSGFKLNAGGELNHVYCPSNYEIGGEHYECVTDEGSDLNARTLHTPLIIRNSTILQPPPAHPVEGAGLTAASFQQSIYGSIQATVYEKNLLAGGNFTLYFGEESGQVYKLTGPDTVKYNRFARCLSTKCPDSHGYFEEFGTYHIAAYLNESKMTWEHNFIDNGLEECKLGVGVCY